MSSLTGFIIYLHHPNSANPTTASTAPLFHPFSATRQTEDQRRDKQLSGEACRSLQQRHDWQHTPYPHFFDLPGTSSQLPGTTDGPGVSTQARQLSEAAHSHCIRARIRGLVDCCGGIGRFKASNPFSVIDWAHLVQCHQLNYSQTRVIGAHLVQQANKKQILEIINKWT